MLSLERHEGTEIPLPEDMDAPRIGNEELGIRINNVPFSHLIRLRRSRIASRKGKYRRY